MGLIHPSKVHYHIKILQLYLAAFCTTNSKRQCILSPRLALLPSASSENVLVVAKMVSECADRTIMMSQPPGSHLDLCSDLRAF